MMKQNDEMMKQNGNDEMMKQNDEMMKQNAEMMNGAGSKQFEKIAQNEGFLENFQR